jgi:prevent-host-death family protein
VFDWSGVVTGSEGLTAQMGSIEFTPTEDIISVTDLKNSLTQALDKVERTKRSTIVLRNGKPKSAIVEIHLYQEMLRLAELGRRQQPQEG